MARYRGKFEEKRPAAGTKPVREPVARGKKQPSRRKGRGVLTGGLLVLFAALIVVSGWKLLDARREYQTGSDTYAALTRTVIRPAAQPSTESKPLTEMELQVDREETPQESAPAAEPEEEQPLLVDFDLLSGINRHTVGWISSADTVINYPVVQGNDNDYYLTHLFDGTVNKNGSIFVDYRNTPGFADRNTFIYGHNMRNGTMFAGLSQYGTAGYYEQHPELILETPEGAYSLQVFSGYVTPGNSDIYQLEYRDDGDFEAYLEKIRLLSDFTTPVPVTAQDRIVTLSTCTYDYEDARYVVHCKLVPMQ